MALSLTFRSYELPLRHPFTISRYTVNVQQTMIVCISDGTFSGYGEATANPYYNSTVDGLAVSIIKAKPFVESFEGHPEDLWKIVAPLLRDNYFALCAIDMAYWDFYARRSGKALRSFWSDEDAPTPLTSFTIAIDTIEMMQRKILEMPWPVYKIKLGTKQDLKIVETLRKTTNSIFRIDANGAWSADEAIVYSKIFKDRNVEFIEQPLKVDDFEGMRKVKDGSFLPIIADESCQKEADVLTCTPFFHGINIKLMKCGGVTAALRMIKTARENNLLLMAGRMTESTVGISGLVQLAPLLDFIDSDGSLLLAKDIARGVAFDYGKILFPKSSGTGVELS